MFEDLKTYPSVFAVNDEYQIFVSAKSEMLVWLEVNGEEYFDDSNGILRSGRLIHKISVPLTELDEAKKYTLCYRRVFERRAYFSKTDEKVNKFEFDFHPVEGDRIRIYHISDTHNKVDTPVKAALLKDFDVLILNGDVPEDSSNIERFDTIYNIAGEITKGQIPVVFSRGNHDLRGIAAEKLADYTPTDNGKSYYTFRVGCLWGIILDCGEDKYDFSEEYGHTICCTNFRKRETKFLEKVIENAENEYNAEGVKYKLVICHVPFFEDFRHPFNVDEEIFGYWTKLLRESVKPDLMYAGHHHRNLIRHIGNKHDYHNQPCPCVIGSNPCLKLKKEEGIDKFIGCYTELNGREAFVDFNDNNNETLTRHRFLLGEEDNGDIED